MAKRKRPLLADYGHVHHDPSAGWLREPEYKANGRHLTEGTEVAIHGEGGTRFRFICAVTTEAGKHWLDFYEDSKGGSRYRSFYPDRIRTVHRLSKTRKNLLAELDAA